MPDGASAGACKLLKGLLNRDAGKRLGAARGTMFEMGGVGALKQQVSKQLDLGILFLCRLQALQLTTYLHFLLQHSPSFQDWTGES